MKSKRIESGNYILNHECVGSFRVWQERCSFVDSTKRWFVNYEPDNLGETLTMHGFRTKWEAVRWLEREIETGDWWCRQCNEQMPADHLTGGVCDECMKEECPTCNGDGYDPDDEECAECDDCGGDGVV